MSDATGRQAQSPTDSCPECGAPRAGGLTCWEQLGAILGWESGDPELRAQHFLTVACYNIQHPAMFTPETVRDLRAGLIDQLDKGTPVYELRRRAARKYAGSRRVLKPEAEREPALRQWGMTIAGVYLPDEPQGAAERVRRWAATVRREL